MKAVIPFSIDLIKPKDTTFTDIPIEIFEDNIYIYIYIYIYITYTKINQKVLRWESNYVLTLETDEGCPAFLPLLPYL